MKVVHSLFSMILLLVTGACASNVAPTPSPTESVVEPGPTATARLQATATPEGYPALPSPTPMPDGYPANPTPQLQPTGYPAGSIVWIIRPLGEQCADPETYEYADLEAATNALLEAQILVLTAETTERAVCAACGCPTGEHFRVQISTQDLSAAEGLGWERE